MDNIIFQSISSWRFDCNQNWHLECLNDVFYLYCFDIFNTEKAIEIFNSETTYFEYIYGISEKMLQEKPKILKKDEIAFFEYIYKAKHYKAQNVKKDEIILSVFNVCKNIFFRMLQTNEVKIRLKNDQFSRIQLQCILEPEKLNVENLKEFTSDFIRRGNYVIDGLDKIAKALR